MHLSYCLTFHGVKAFEEKEDIDCRVAADEGLHLLGMNQEQVQRLHWRQDHFVHVFDIEEHTSHPRRAHFSNNLNYTCC